MACLLTIGKVAVDRPKRQTSTVTQAKPGDYPFYLRVALLDYAKDLPSSADSGNILLSNASMAIVYRLYVQFQNELPEWAAASLETLFQASECELTQSTRERLVKMLPPGTEQLRMIEQ